MKSIMERVKEEERREFLKRSPLERMETMHNLFLQFLSLKATGEGVSEYEIYCRYLKDNPRTYERPSQHGRYNPPPEEDVREAPEEYL